MIISYKTKPFKNLLYLKWRASFFFFFFLQWWYQRMSCLDYSRLYQHLGLPSCRPICVLCGAVQHTHVPMQPWAEQNVMTPSWIFWPAYGCLSRACLLKRSRFGMGLHTRVLMIHCFWCLVQQVNALSVLKMFPTKQAVGRVIRNSTPQECVLHVVLITKLGLLQWLWQSISRTFTQCTFDNNLSSTNNKICFA